MSSTVVQPPASGPAPLSEVARIVDTFVAPSKTFTDLRRSARWWAPFLILVVVGIAFAYVVDKKIGFDKVAEYQVQISPKASAQLDRLSPEDRNAQMHGRTVVTKYISYGFFVFLLIINAVIALVLFATFKFAANADVKFSTSLAIVTYAGLPGGLKIVLAMVLIAVGVSPDSFNIQNSIGTNIGYYLDPSNSLFLYGLLSRFDIFTFWSLTLSALGFVYAGKVKKSTALTVVFGWFLLITVLGAAIGAATA